MVKIYWDEKCPQEIQAALQPILIDYTYLVPTWCHELRIYYSPYDDDSSMFVNVHPQYRFAKLTVCPAWILADHTLRVEQTIHELLHIPLATLTKFLEDLTSRLCKEDEVLHEWARHQLEKDFEGVVCDLTYSIKEYERGDKVPKMKNKLY